MKQKLLIAGKIEVKSHGKIFGGTPKRTSLHTSVPRHTG